MLRIAIIQFPGLNTEYETRREINKTGMSGEFFRWNDDAAKLRSYDGYVIGGGFAYEDRGRAGIIAALDPLMKVVAQEAAKGKPVLGICNGAQILVESGLIPGVDGNKLAMALGRNKRIREGHVLGTGYYNAQVHFKCTVPKEHNLFTWNIAEGEILKAPIAHGEGRFTTEIPDLIPRLLEKKQVVFRYCDAHGVIMDHFPVNPNGAMFNIAAICNPAGNVMAVMPHLERNLHASAKLFESLKYGLLAKKSGAETRKKRAHHLPLKPPSLWPLPPFQKKAKSFEMLISLIITDNEAETHSFALKDLGFPKVSLMRKTHIELEYRGRLDKEKLLKRLIQSGVLLNTNKERVQMENTEATFRLLVREKADYIGLSKLSVINNRLKIPEITGVHIGTLWNINVPTKSAKVAEEELKRMTATHLFFNPHRQEAFLRS